METIAHPRRACTAQSTPKCEHCGARLGPYNYRGTWLGLPGIDETTPAHRWKCSCGYLTYRRAAEGSVA